MNTQDLEDFNQDFALCMHTSKYSAGRAASKRKLFLKQRRSALAKNAAQLVSYDDSKLYVGETDYDSETIFNVLLKSDLLKNKQRSVILAFIRHGDLTKVAAELGQNYNTTKANFRAAVLNLRRML